MGTSALSGRDYARWSRSHYDLRTCSGARLHSMRASRQGGPGRRRARTFAGAPGPRRFVNEQAYLQPSLDEATRSRPKKCELCSEFTEA